MIELVKLVTLFSQLVNFVNSSTYSFCQIAGCDSGLRRRGRRRDVRVEGGGRAVRHDGGAAAAEAGQARPDTGVQDRRSLLGIVAPPGVARVQGRLQSSLHRYTQMKDLLFTGNKVRQVNG